MKRNNPSCHRGQSLIEYAMTIILIITGFLVGSPILINAINAHFKLLDNATQDSLTEHIKRGALPDESCTWEENWHDTGECGVTAGCLALDQLQKRYCKRNGTIIETETQCQKSSDCCSQPIINSCGSLLPSECPSRAPLSNKFGPNYQGVCLLTNKRNSFNCRIGERLTSITCGKITHTQTSTDDDDEDDEEDWEDITDDDLMDFDGDENDPAGVENNEDVLSYEVFFACTTDTFDACFPKCSPHLSHIPLASNCYPNSDHRYSLENEVRNRKTTYAQQKPYRNITRFTPQEARQDTSIMNGTVKIPYAFVSSADECHPDRYCEAFCDQVGGDVYLPTSDGTACAKAVCETTKHFSLDLPEHHFKTKILPYQTTFTVDLPPHQQAKITYWDTNGNERINTPNLSTETQTISITSNYFAIDITPIETNSTAPGFALTIEDECFAYQPSRIMSLNTPLLYACQENQKVITDPKAYHRYCSTFDQAPYKNARPYSTQVHTVGCVVEESSINQSSANYFVFCE